MPWKPPHSCVGSSHDKSGSSRICAQHPDDELYLSTDSVDDLFTDFICEYGFNPDGSVLLIGLPFVYVNKFLSARDGSLVRNLPSAGL
jgi:hypothetical protein